LLSQALTELSDDGDPRVAAVASLIECSIAAAESVALVDIDAAREAVACARAAVVTATYLTSSMLGDPSITRAARSEASASEARRTSKRSFHDELDVPAPVST
jgi:hypothetical protein